MTLSRANLQKKLAPRPVRYYYAVGSTNDLAKAWIQTGAESGSVVVADKQRKGRGRLNRSWTTPHKQAIAMSVILKPPVESLNMINMIGGLAVIELLDHLKIENCGLKWPNDVLINDRKVSGILAEAFWEDNQLEGVVLGIGINVRVDFTNTPLADTAISIESVLDSPVNRTDLLAYVLSRIDHWIARIESTEILEAWKNRLSSLGKIITVTDGQNEEYTGVAEDVDTDGTLLLRISDTDELKRIVAGDVHFS